MSSQLAGISDTTGSSRGDGHSVNASDTNSAVSQTPSVDKSRPKDAWSTDAASGFTSHVTSSHVIGETTGIAQRATPVSPNAWVKPPQVIPNRTSSSTSSSTTLTASDIRRQHSTYIIRRAPPDITPQVAIQSIAHQMCLPPGALFESVLRDPHDRRRLYLVFKSPQIRDEIAAKGFRLGNVTIKPTDGALHGYIPFPPYFVDHTPLILILSKFGQITTHNFVTTSDGIRVAGFQFQMKLKPNVAPPREIVYGGCTMAIRYADDIRKCGFCHSFGHTIRYCRKRIAADEERKLKASLQTDAPVTTSDPASAEKSTKLAKHWQAAQTQLIAEESKIIEELLFHQYCKVTALNDATEELKTKRSAEKPGRVDMSSEIAEIKSTILQSITEEWQKEWRDIRQRYHQLRTDDHATFRRNGLSDEHSAHPLGMEEILEPQAFPNFSTVATDDTKITNYIRDYGFAHEMMKKLQDRFGEVTDDDEEMLSESEDDEPESANVSTKVSRKSSVVSGVSNISEKILSEEEIDEILSGSKYIRPPKLNLPDNDETSKTITNETTTQRSDTEFPKEEYDRFRSMLPKTYSKSNCKNAIRLEADTTVHHIKHLIWNYFHRLSKKPNYEHLNPVSIIPVDCGEGTYAIYVPDEMIGDQLRLHLSLRETKKELRTTKVGSVKANKSYRQSDPT